jgi:hypothetical protein
MANKTKHTPGPWKIMQCTPRIQQYEGQTETVIVDENNRNILNRDVCEEAANARLIAASPELLAACKDSLRFILAKIPQGHSRERAVLENVLRDAIVKAERGE